MVCGQYLVLVKPFDKRLLEANIGILSDVRGEADDVKVSLKIVDDHCLPNCNNINQSEPRVAS